MDGILSLFENIGLPNEHAFIFDEYLKICADHQVFINKTSNDVKPVISYMNEKLNSTSNRLEGLHMLQTFLPQCLKEIFRDNVLGWLHQCLRGTEGKNTQIARLSYRVIKTLLDMTQQLPEMRRNVGSIVVIKLVENLQIKCPSQSLLAILECLETLMFHYGPACGHHKNVLEKVLLQHIDSGDRKIVNRLARCMAQVPLLSNAGPSGANHITRWYQEQQRLCTTLHGILEELFYFVEENQSMFDVTISTTKLPIPDVSNNHSPLTKILRLVNRFINVAEILQGLLLMKFSADKTLNVEGVFHIVFRGLHVTVKSFSDSAAAEIQMTRALLPRIHIALLNVLDSLIVCAGYNLVSYGPIICREVYHVLSWTSTPKWPYSIEKPYGKLRAAACFTLTLWLQTTNSSSCMEKVADKLVNNLIPDINPGKTAVTLIEDATPKKGSSKQQKKSTIAERSNQSTAISPNIEVNLVSPNANSEICIAALRAMQWLLATSSTCINPVIHEKLQNITVKLLNDIQMTGKRDLVPVPYGDGCCRRELYKLLLMLVMNPHPQRPVPTNQALSIFVRGSSDSYQQVVAACKTGSGCLEKLVTGTRPTWHFPITMEEMLDSINAQREDMEQEIEDEVEPMEDEAVEEEEDIGEEEEEEEEDEDDEEEEIEDELELSKIKVGEAVTLLPDKAAPEQMEVEKEEPAKKTENKKAQRPVEKPETNKKDEEDEVEVLTEDEAEWPISKDRKEKIASEANEMIEDDEEFASDEDEEGIEIRDDEDLDEDYEDEDEDSAEIDSEGEELEQGFIVRNNPIKIIPVEVEKKDAAISESKTDIQKSEVTQQLAESVTEVALASTEHIQSQDKVSLPSANSNQEKAKELDSSVEEVQVENLEQSNEILKSSVEENAEQSKEVVNTATEETEESAAKEDHISEKMDTNSQNEEVEEDGVVEEASEFQDLEDHIAVSIVEKSKNEMEYQLIDDRDDVQDEGNDDGMHEDCDEEQLEEENAFESKNDVPVEHQEESQNEVLEAPDKMTEENDKDITEEPVHEPEVNENICETAGNELIENDVATVESEVVEHEDDTSLKLEVYDEIEKQDVLEEGGGDKKEDTCEQEEFVSQQDSDIPKPEDHVLSDEVCIDKDNTVVDSGDSEANLAAISEIKAVEAEDVQMDVNEMPETELNAAAQKIAHSPEDELEEPSRKKMKMDITATLTDGPKAIDTEISNNSADVKLNSTGEITRSERVMNGTATAADEITEEELIASFVPELATDE